ncbi:hemolysin family protein [Salmonirosea aquatica]|uniref:HlyC/CorC family transporter n=1 Tax=Salmonirosea aquatica TaxID=2654236 RepID=A0A7C9BF76_9BACT|nr:HlyC/CorC family transporter [Cytophagaceae bacterium SJW1-29]
MINPYPVLAVFFFVLAGYYGAVRAILLDSPLEWMQMSPESDVKAHSLAYWRRMLRMNRLMLVAFGCFCLVASNHTVWPEVLDWPRALYWVVFSLVAFAAWVVTYVLWLRAGRAFPRLVSMRAFPVRLAEWLLTPVYWLVEPFIKSAPPATAGRLVSQIRDETAVADDSDFEDNRIEERMFINALDFKDVRIRDCMIPRTEITAVALDDEIEDLRQAFISSGHSKIIVYRESIDDVAGYCHSLALFRKPKEIASIVTPMLIVPEAMPASDLMLRFLEERKSLALVVDEFGGTSGLVSVEDVVEQIFGEIQDEYDSTEDWTERKVDENTYLLSARHEVDYLNEKYDWELPEGDYDTLAGMLIHIHGDLPKVNDLIDLPPYTFQVISMQDTRIELVRLTVGEEA